jgi:predicted ABC-type ATPase
MSNIYIIAGPPGIGKSTLGESFIPPDMDILNEDEMRFKYKAQGYADYNEYSIHRVHDTIRKNLIKDEDFALELNLGFAHQFEYTLSIKRFNFDNKLYVVLFFTDDLDLCKDRAKKRYESGRHLVEPETIEKMCNNTLPLLKANFEAVDHLILLNANRNDELNAVAEYDKEAGTLNILDDSAVWFKDDLMGFIRGYLVRGKGRL